MGDAEASLRGASAPWGAPKFPGSQLLGQVRPSWLPDRPEQDGLLDAGDVRKAGNGVEREVPEMVHVL